MRALLTARTLPCSVALFTAAVLFLVPIGARAQDATTAGDDDKLIASGVALRKQGRDAEALAVFRRAYDVRASPRAMVQIALANQALGRWPEAEQGLLEAMRSTDDEWIARNRAHLEESLAAVQAHLASLVVESNIPAAEVRVDGELVGRLPLDRPLRVAEGDVTLELRAVGYAAIVRTLHADAKSQVRAEFTFVAPAAAPTDRDNSKSALERSPPTDTSGGARRWGFITLAAAGGFALIGVAGVVTREWEAQIYNDDSRCGPMDGISRASRCGTNRDIGMAAQTTAIVAFVGSGAAAAGAAFTFLVRQRPAPNQVSCRVAWAGLTCGAAF